MKINMLKKVEKIGLLKSLLRKDYPPYISKGFSDRVMSKIYSQASSLGSQAGYGVRIASTVTFALLTLFLIQNITQEDISYSKSYIDEEIISPTKNVVNEIDGCNDSPTRKNIHKDIECD